jgi:hypothetical protein
MVLGETPEVQIAEDVAEKNETLKSCRFKKFDGVAGPADLAAEVYV